MQGRVGRWGGLLLGGILVGACAGGEVPAQEGATSDAGPLAFDTRASTTVHEPMPGEGHLANIRQLTFGGNNAEAYFSADGTRLIFQRQDSISTGCDQQYVMNIDGSGMRRISNGKGRTTCGFFIEGDRRVIYASTQAHAPGCPARPDDSMGYVWPLGNLELYTANPDGSATRQVTDNGAYNAEATASPDGSRVIFTSTMDGDIELYTMQVDGTDIRRITNRVGYDGGAFFSPDGSKIVWRAQYPETAADTADYLALLEQRVVRPSHLEIWVADADGGNARQLTDVGGANFAPIFHPDGERIIWSSNTGSPDGRTFELYMMRLDGTGMQQVTHSADFNSFPMFSPDGSRLVFASNRHGSQPRETNLFIADWVE
jgi:Tol biopolymer transport system component